MDGVPGVAVGNGQPVGCIKALTGEEIDSGCGICIDIGGGCPLYTGNGLCIVEFYLVGGTHDTGLCLGGS